MSHRFDRLILSPVIGHRGAAARAPENTLAGLRAAALLGAGMVEFDVQLTSDGVPVLMHDPTVDRTTNGQGAIAGMAADDLTPLDAGAWFSPDFTGEPVPTLADALVLCVELGLVANIELKLDGETAAARRAGARIAAAAAAQWPGDRPPPLLSSFSQAALSGAAAVVPDWPRGYLLSGAPDGWQQRAAQIGAATLNVHRIDDPPGSHDAFLAFGRPVLAYTVNDPDEARSLFAKGITGLFSDEPDTILAVLPE